MRNDASNTMYDIEDNYSVIVLMQYSNISLCHVLLYMLLRIQISVGYNFKHNFLLIILSDPIGRRFSG